MDLTKPGPLPDFARELIAEVDRRTGNALGLLTRGMNALASSVEETQGTVRRINSDHEALAGHIEALERRSGNDAMAEVDGRLRDLARRLSALENKPGSVANPVKAKPKAAGKPANGKAAGS